MLSPKKHQKMTSLLRKQEPLTVEPGAMDQGATVFHYNSLINRLGKLSAPERLELMREMLVHASTNEIKAYTSAIDEHLAKAE